MTDSKSDAPKFDKKLVKLIAKELHRADFSAAQGETKADKGARITDFRENRIAYNKKARILLRRLTQNGVGLSLGTAGA